MLRMRYLAGAHASEVAEMGRSMRAAAPRGGPVRQEITPLARIFAAFLALFLVGLVIYAAHSTDDDVQRKTFKPLDEVKWGIIGCGDVTERKSGPALQLIAHSRLTAVMRRNATLAEDYARRHGVPKWGSSAEDLISDPDVNAIYVATPPLFHAKYALLAAEMGKPVYVEKPMGVSHVAGANIVATFKRKGLPLHVAYYRRALPNFLKIKSLLEEGVIGTPRAVHVAYHRPPNKGDLIWAAAGGSMLPSGSALRNGTLPWRTDPMVGGTGGYFRDKGSHQLDLLEYWFGPIISVSGSASNQGGLYPAEDTVVASFTFSNGVHGTGSWCFVASESGHEEYGTVTGSKGKLRFQFFKSNRIEIWNQTGYTELEVPNPKHVQQPLLETVVKALRGEGESASTGESALRTSRVMDCILEGRSLSLSRPLSPSPNSAY